MIFTSIFLGSVLWLDIIEISFIDPYIHNIIVNKLYNNELFLKK